MLWTVKDTCKIIYSLSHIARLIQIGQIILVDVMYRVQVSICN